MKCALVASCLHLLLMLLAATALFHFVSKNTIGVDSTLSCILHHHIIPYVIANF